MSSDFSLVDDLACTKVKLGNGLTVLVNRDDTGECGDLGYLIITVKTGSNSEQAGKRGIAHLYEHLCFRNVPLNGELSFLSEMNILGANYGASTTYDAIKFFDKFPKDNLEKILEIESLRFGNVCSGITFEDINCEVEIIRNERNNSIIDSPLRAIEELMLESLFEPPHPMSTGIIGQFDHIESITKDDLIEFEKRWITPEHTYISVIGNFEPDYVIDIITKHFGKKQLEIRHYYYKNERLSPGIMICSPGAGKFSNDWLVLSFILKYLKFEEIVASYEHRGSLEYGYFFVMLYNKGHKEDYREYLLKLADLTASSISKAQYSMIKESLIKELEAFKSPVSALSEQTLLNIARGDLSYKKLIEFIKSISQADVDDVLRRYFKENRHSTISIVMQGEENRAIQGSSELFNCPTWTFKATQKETKPETSSTASNEADSLENQFNREIKIPELINSTPPVWKFKLPNGIKVYGSTLEKTKIIEGTIYIFVNRDAEREGLSGINLFCSEALKGTKRLSFEMFEKKAKTLSSSINIKCFPEYIAINFKTSRKYAMSLFALIEQAIINPRINDSSLSKQKKHYEYSDKTTGFDFFSHSFALFPLLAFGDKHNYSRKPQGKPQDQKNISALAVQNHYNKFFKPDITKICVTGDIDKAFCKKLLSSLSCNWTGKHARFPNPTPAHPQPCKKLYFFDSPGGDNVLISFFGVTPPLRKKDNHLLTLANTMLGDTHGTSLLFKKLRGEEGLAYAVESQIYTMGKYRYFYAAATTNTINADKVFRKMADTIYGYADQFDYDMMQSTLHSAISYRNSRLNSIERQLFVLTAMALHNLNYHYDLWRDNILKTVTIDEIKDVSRKYLNPDNLYCLVIGSKAQLLPILSELDYGEVVEVELMQGFIPQT